MKEFYIEKAKCYMRYYDYPGKDGNILFIHGLGCAGSLDYTELTMECELLNYRRIVVDLIGAGYSDSTDSCSYSIIEHAEYLNEFINYLKLDNLIIYGHSLGGTIAIELAKLCEKKVKCLIVNEANLIESVNGSFSRQIYNMGEDFFNEKDYHSLLKGNNLGGVMGAWNASVKTWTSKSLFGLSKAACTDVNEKFMEEFIGLNIKKCFICGDKSVKDFDLKYLKDNKVHVRIVEKSGHGMAFENPKGLAKAISYEIKDEIK